MNVNLFRNYYFLTKPGIIYGNAITAAAGFFLASRGHISLSLFISMLLGLSFVIASACIFNNYIDRDIDKKMERTKNRPSVTGLVSIRAAMIYAIILGLLGFGILYFYTNFLTTMIAFIGFIDYVILYGYSKRHSVHGTVVGSISGATPPVVGYCALTSQFDNGALLLFLILVFWQMPHFYAIAIYRMKDYAAAKIPVLPIKMGIFVTKIQMILYIIAFIFTTVLLHIFGYAGKIYLVSVVVIGLVWLGFGLKGFTNHDTNHWARKMFFLSLIIITFLSVLLSVDSVIH